jgi:DedD protein
MKKDHNLDDLIIDDIKPVKNKSKSVLTMIALVIVVLIVVIVATRMFVGDNEHNTTAADNNEEVMISPDLQLDDSEHDADADKKELEQLSSMMEESLTDKDTDSDKGLSKQTGTETDKVEKKSESVEMKSDATKPEPAQKEEVASPKTETVSQNPEEMNVAPAKKTYDEPKVSTPATREKPAPRPRPKSTATSGTYFIQVGSFSKSPSKQFLSVIKKNGFHYQLRGGKLLIGPYRNDAAARGDLPRVRSKINKSAFIKHF